MNQSDRTASDASAAPASVKRDAPRMVGRYEILEEIGRGGMGIVHKALQPDLDRLVALKELQSVHASAPEVVQRFARESRMASSLNHPNIVTVYDFVEEGRTSYIAMEYMPRGSLRPWVGDLSLAQIAGVLEGLLAGLAAVEPSGIVHRDLKPENLMVTGDGRVKITDFGIAKATQNASVTSFMTATGTTVGTPAYMAPEQALAHTIGPWTDLYSVGIMTYEQLVGRLPFHDSPTPVAILLRHVNEPIPPVIDSRPDIDRSLSEWVARLLVKEPTERTPNAAQAWEELEEIIIDLLGPRWRRDARLPDLGSGTAGLKPLTPAPFASQMLETPTGSPTQRPATGLPAPATTPAQPPSTPQAESGFLSYGRAPTGVEQQQPPAVPPEQPPKTSPVSARHESVEQRQQAASQSTAEPGTPRTAPVSRRFAEVTRHRARRLSAVALLTALTASVGFVLASTGESSKVPARSPVSADVGPSRAYAAALSDVMSKLNGIRAAAGGQLAHAGSARTQALAAERLTRAHNQAATVMRSAKPAARERAANAAIVAALIGVGKGYSTMASAAHGENRRGFDDARKVITKETAALTTALARLPALGYKLGS